MNFNKITKKSVIDALYKAFLGVFFFSIVYYSYNLEFTRANVGDNAFDIMNKFKFSSTESKIDHKFPNVLIYSIDDNYLKKKKLLNNNDDTTYGYILPRNYIAELIEDVDNRVRYLNKSDQPVALFIDMSMRYTSFPDNDKLSKNDLLLIDTLLKERDYPILISKSKSNNYIQQLIKKENGKYKDRALKINELISQEKIIFVSVQFLKSQDGITRRYLPYENYTNCINDSRANETYYHFAVAAWQLSKYGSLKKDITKEEVISNFKEEIYHSDYIKYGYDIVESNILYKMYSSDGDATISNWRDDTELYKHVTYSANLINNAGNPAKSIIMIGVDHTFSNDVKKVNFDITKSELSGLQLHAQTLMTLFYSDGKLQRYDLFYSISIVFFVFFFVDIFINSILPKASSQVTFIISILIILVIFFAISAYLLQYQKQWFNWSIPIIFFWIEELVEFIKRYFSKLTPFKEVK